jgi:DNA invertase Pin-like site-specific DNA recombinase
MHRRSKAASEGNRGRVGTPTSLRPSTPTMEDLGTASGKLMRTVMAGHAEFDRDLIRERVRSRRCKKAEHVMVAPPMGKMAYRSVSSKQQSDRLVPQTQ